MRRGGVQERTSQPRKPGGRGNRKIDYDQLFKDAVAQLPYEALHVPHIGILEPICPYCKTQLKKMPGAKTKCKSCGNSIYVRQRPSDNQKVLLTDAQRSDINKLWGHKKRLEVLAETLGNFKGDLNRYQDANLSRWQMLGVNMLDADPVERELDGKIVVMGSAEEREMLKYLCDPRYRFCPISVVKIP